MICPVVGPGNICLHCGSSIILTSGTIKDTFPWLGNSIDRISYFQCLGTCGKKFYTGYDKDGKIGPRCASPYTFIIPNSDRYGCAECNCTFGQVVGNRNQCPICGSSNITDEIDYYQCHQPNCNQIFGKVIDAEVLFPYSVIFPDRDQSEFYRLELYKK